MEGPSNVGVNRPLLVTILVLDRHFQTKKFGVSNGGQAATSNPVSQVLW